MSRYVLKEKQGRYLRQSVAVEIHRQVDDGSDELNAQEIGDLTTSINIMRDADSSCDDLASSIA
mgnify:CR=1 FL=1